MVVTVGLSLCNAPGWCIHTISMPNYPFMKKILLDVRISMPCPCTMDVYRLFLSEWIYEHGYYHGFCMDTPIRSLQLGVWIPCNTKWTSNVFNVRISYSFLLLPIFNFLHAKVLVLKCNLMITTKGRPTFFFFFFKIILNRFVRDFC